MPPHLLHYETFDLKELPNKPGLYVAELVGGGKACRAIIRKGGLSLVSQTTPKGHIAYVIDEAGNICKDNAALLFRNKRYDADRDGKITIPFGSESHEEPGVIIHKGFAALTDFEQLSERYNLTAAFIVSDEAFLVGSRAKIQVRAALTINGEAADLKLLRKVSVNIKTVVDGDPAT